MPDTVKRNISIKENHSIVRVVKMLCIEADTSIPKLEKILKFSNGSIYNWDKSSPSVDKIIKVAIYFGVTSDYLLGIKSKAVC